MSKYTNEQWIDIFKKIHGNDKYDYSQTDINNKDDKGKIKVICKKHGIFYINPFITIKELYLFSFTKCFNNRQ